MGNLTPLPTLDWIREKLGLPKKGQRFDPQKVYRSKRYQALCPYCEKVFTKEFPGMTYCCSEHVKLDRQPKARAMTHLYSCKSISNLEYRITKFDHDFNVMSSYIMTNGGCDCPQGHKPTCRHRKMLPAFAKEGHIDDGYFYEWETRTWRKPLPTLDADDPVYGIKAKGDALRAIAQSLETELSPKAATISEPPLVLPSVPPVAPVVEHRAAPSGNHSPTGGTTFKRRSLGK